MAVEFGPPRCASQEQEQEQEKQQLAQARTAPGQHLIMQKTNSETGPFLQRPQEASEPSVISPSPSLRAPLLFPPVSLVSNEAVSSFLCFFFSPPPPFHTPGWEASKPSPGLLLCNGKLAVEVFPSFVGFARR